MRSGLSFQEVERDDFTEDVIIAHPKHAYISGLLEEDRVVFTGSLTGDAFVTVIDEPARALDSYIGASDVLDFADYRDFIENRSPKRNPHVLNYVDGALNPTEPDAEFGLQYDEDGHHLAPRIVHGLQNTVTLNNDWETTFHPHVQLCSNESADRSGPVPFRRRRCRLSPAARCPTTR